MGDVTNKHLVRRVFYALILLITIIQAYPIEGVYAQKNKEAYTGSYDVKLPVTWHQSLAPYSSDEWGYCTANNYGDCSCGVHAVASLLLKTGYWGVGKDAVDGSDFASQHNVLSTCIATKSTGVCLPDDEASQYSQTGSLPSHLVKGPIYHYEKLEQATDGHLKFIEEHSNQGNYLSDAKQILTDAYQNGYFAVMGVDLGAEGEGHAIILDYVDTNGDVIIIDSGGRYKYLDAMYGIKRIHLFEVKGLKSYDAPKLWLKEALFEKGVADGASNTRADSGGEEIKANESGNSNMIGELEDPFTWLDNPIVYYDEDEVDPTRNNTGKGLSNSNNGWLNWLFK